MAGILFFKKNYLDLSNTDPTITITDAVATDNGQDYVALMQNRQNTSGWMTTDSTDAALTQIDIDLIDEHDLTDIIIVGHNLKSYTIQYWNGSAYTDFSTAISPTADAATTTRHSFTEVSARLIRIIINGCQVVDADKQISQLILTKSLGQFTTQPKIKRPQHSKNRKGTKTLSGKHHVTRSVGGFSVSLEKDNVIDTTDLTLVETLFDEHQGFLVWLCGGDTSVFRTQRIGYRLQDIYLMKPLNEYEPEWSDGRFQHGTPISFDLAEVI